MQILAGQQFLRHNTILDICTSNFEIVGKKIERAILIVQMADFT